MTLENNLFFSIHKLIEQNILKLIWKNKSDDLNHRLNQYKNLILQWVILVQYHRPKAVLVDTREHLMIIDPNLQQWFVDEVFPKYEQSGIRKLAFITSHDFVSQLSIEQTMDEVTNSSFQIQYFSCLEKGLDWACK